MQSSNTGVIAVGAAAAVFAAVVGGLLVIRSADGTETAGPTTQPSVPAASSPTPARTTPPSASPSTATTPSPEPSGSETPTADPRSSTPTPDTTLDAGSLGFSGKKWGPATSTVSVEAPDGWTFTQPDTLVGRFLSPGGRLLKVDAGRTTTHGKTTEEDAAAREKELQSLAAKGTIKDLRFLSREPGSIVAKGGEGLDRAWSSRDFTYTDSGGVVREVHLRWIELNAGQSADPTSVVITVGGSPVDYAALIKIMDRATKSVTIAG